MNGDALLTEMFGEDDPMELDDDYDDAGGAPSLAPDATPSTSTHDVSTPIGSTPPPPSSPNGVPAMNGGSLLGTARLVDHQASKPVVVEHASGPFLSRGPILVDRFEGPKGGGGSASS